MTKHGFKNGAGGTEVFRLFQSMGRILLTASIGACSGLPGAKLERISLPPGFSIRLYQNDVPGARTLAFGDQGTLFVGAYEEGKIYAIPARRDGTGKVLVIAEQLQSPYGIAFKDGALYVAERSRIVRFDDIENRLDHPPKPAVFYDLGLKYARQGLRVLHFGPDGKLYVSIGVPELDRYSVILRIDLGGSAEVYAHGIRNSAGYDWHPETHELWFIDNGRDLLGRDAPPGMHFGYPYCLAGELADPVSGLGRPCSGFTRPTQRLGPAALGMRFYTGCQFPSAYRNRIFIAEHGSWNRSPKLGYRISMVTLSGNDAVHYEPFAEGWLQGSTAWGRPVDVAVAPDGSLLVSDDKQGAVYRISYDDGR